MHFPSWFATSVLPVEENVVKNVLFRVAALLLQLTVLKVFTHLASKSRAYTSYLMFAEDMIQKLLFSYSRGLSRQSFLVIGFALFVSAAGFYDTFLWALDSPGYVIKTSRVSAAAVVNEMISNPAYISSITDPSRDASLVNLDQAMTGNLYKSGFNFTFPGRVAGGTIETVPDVLPFNLTGPRIWLDKDGFGVGVDQSLMITRTFCSIEKSTDVLRGWSCPFPNSSASDLANSHLGQPEVFWDLNNSEYILSNREDSPWESLGSGGDTAVMKQVFTVTKGNRRHTFLETAFKISMVTLYPTPFDDAEIREIVRRTRSTNTSAPIEPAVAALANLVIAAQKNDTSYTMGTLGKINNTVYSSSIELLNVESISLFGAEELFSLLRISSTNITLIRSETLNESVTPLVPCTLYNTNIATGGRLRSNNCYKSLGSQVGARFLGQVDTSSALVIYDVLGDGGTSKSATALNQTGLDWYMNATDRMDHLLISCALILGGDPHTVLVDVQHIIAVLSYLQLLLILIPVCLAGASIIFLLRNDPGYFNSTFLAAVCATTHAGGSNCSKVGYMREPPEVSLLYVGDHAALGLPGGGIISHVETNLGLMYTMGAEPWLRKGIDQVSIDSASSFSSKEIDLVSVNSTSPPSPKEESRLLPP